MAQLERQNQSKKITEVGKTELTIGYLYKENISYVNLTNSLHECKFLKLELKCSKRVTDEGSIPEIVQYGPSSRFECFTASKGSNNYFYYI